MNFWRSIVFTAIVGLGLTALASLLLESYDHRRMQERIQADASSLEANIRASLVRLLYASELTGALLKTSDRTPQQQLPLLRSALASFYQSVKQVNIVDRDLNVIAQTLVSGNELVSAKTYQGTTVNIAQLEQLTNDTLFMPARNFSSRQHDLALFIPIMTTQQSYFVVAVINTQELLKQTIHHHIIEGYQASVQQHNETIYNFSGETELKDLWAADFTISVANSHWYFEMWPTPAKFSDLHMINPLITPLMGMFVTGMLMMLVARIRKQESQLELLQQLNENYNQSLKKRDEVEKQLAYLSEHDALTEVPNRNALIRFLGERLAEVKENKQQLVAIQLNIDHFKDINNALGHKVGDELLKRLAHRLQSSPHNFDFIARIGGDEFLVIKQVATSELQAKELADELTRLVKPQFFIGRHEIYASASIGIAFASEADYDADTLLRHTDAALIEAKLADYHGVATYTRAQQSELSKRQVLLEQLHRAIETHSIIIHYQPMFDLINQHIVGFEALMRWQHEDGELVYPEEFLPLIEDTGLIVPLTDNLIRQVVSDYAEFTQRGNTELTIGINLSGKQLALPELPEILTSHLRRNQVGPESLHIEIKEELYCAHANQDNSVLSTVRDTGVKLTIDGMGLNHATMDAVQNFPPSLLKISQPLMADIPHSKVHALIAETMIKFAHSVGISISAVGVETQQQVDFLIQRDCLIAQGYYLARPLAKQDITKLLASQVKHDAPNS